MPRPSSSLISLLVASFLATVWDHNDDLQPRERSLTISACTNTDDPKACWTPTTVPPLDLSTAASAIATPVDGVGKAGDAWPTSSISSDSTAWAAITEEFTNTRPDGSSASASMSWVHDSTIATTFIDAAIPTTAVAPAPSDNIPTWLSSDENSTATTSATTASEPGSYLVSYFEIPPATIVPYTSCTATETVTIYVMINDTSQIWPSTITQSSTSTISNASAPVTESRPTDSPLSVDTTAIGPPSLFSSSEIDASASMKSSASTAVSTSSPSNSADPFATRSISVTSDASLNISSSQEAITTSPFSADTTESAGLVSSTSSSSLASVNSPTSTESLNMTSSPSNTTAQAVTGNVAFPNTLRHRLKCRWQNPEPNSSNLSNDAHTSQATNTTLATAISSAPHQDVRRELDTPAWTSNLTAIALPLLGKAMIWKSSAASMAGLVSSCVYHNAVAIGLTFMVAAAAL